MGRNRQFMQGYTLVELLTAMGLGLLVLGAAARLYTSALNATWLVSQKTVMQQDGRAALDLIVKDIRMAGTGVGSQEQLFPALASGGTFTPRYGCDTSQCYVNSGNGLTYPVIGGGSPTLYPVIPGYQKGKVINAGNGATDVITIFYADTTFHLSCYTATVTNGTTLTFNYPAVPPDPPNADASCYTDSNNVSHPVKDVKVSDIGIGLKAGDIVYFSGKRTDANSTLIVGEVTSVTGANAPYTVKFNDPDALHLNQATATLNSFAATSGGVQLNVGAVGTVYRLWVITYYLDVPTSTGLPTLMRQVNGQTPTPVAENISDLRFSYQIYDSNMAPTPYATYDDAGLSSNKSPSLIKKVNIKHLTMRSPLAGTRGFQGTDMQTSITVRTLGFTDQFPLTSSN